MKTIWLADLHLKEMQYIEELQIGETGKIILLGLGYNKHRVTNILFVL